MQALVHQIRILTYSVSSSTRMVTAFIRVCIKYRYATNIHYQWIAKHIRITTRYPADSLRESLAIYTTWVIRMSVRLCNGYTERSLTENCVVPLDTDKSTSTPVSLARASGLTSLADETLRSR